MPLTIYRRGEIWHYRGTVAGRLLRGSTRTADKTTAQRIAAGRAWADGTRRGLRYAEGGARETEEGKKAVSGYSRLR
jgi:hypothetical protein